MTLPPGIVRGRWRPRHAVGGGLLPAALAVVVLACGTGTWRVPRQPARSEPTQTTGWLARWTERLRPSREPEQPVFTQILPPLAASGASSPMTRIARSPAMTRGWSGGSARPLLIESGGPPAPLPADRALADVLTSMVAAAEAGNLDLREIDLEIEEIDREMVDIYHSEGWELEIESRQVELDDTTRRESRAGRTRQLDGDFRSAYNLTGDLEDNMSEFTLRLVRSWGHPDHEKYVDIGLKRLAKMDAVIRKQEVRRDLHLILLNTILDILSRQAVRPLQDAQARLLEEKLERLRKYYEAERREALLKDVLEAEHALDEARRQAWIDEQTIAVSRATLKRMTGGEIPSLPTSAALSVDTLRPPRHWSEPETTSYALAGRLDYRIGRMRLDLGETMAKYMAWYWPTLDLEIFWTRFHGHRNWLDEYRREKGKERGFELTFAVPLNLLARGRARQQAFRAARDRYALELEQMRETIAQSVLQTYLLRCQADLNCLKARNQLEHDVEVARELRVQAESLPDSVAGIPEIKVLDAELDVAAARVALCRAKYQLFRTKAQWDYLVGDSPIDTVVAPQLARERRAVEKKGWIRWWTSLLE